MAIRCLIVDDNEQFLRVARGLLEHEGLLVVAVATSVAEAVRRADALRPDLALVDINLGYESGFELARRLTAVPSLSVILMSTYSEGDYRHLLATAPNIGYLTKAELSGPAMRRSCRTATAGSPAPQQEAGRRGGQHDGRGARPREHPPRPERRRQRPAERGAHG